MRVSDSRLDVSCRVTASICISHLLRYKYNMDNGRINTYRICYFGCYIDPQSTHLIIRGFIQYLDEIRLE